MTIERDPQTVLDASAVLAYLQREPGYETARDALRNGGAISTVNLAEVYTKLVTRELPVDPVAVRLAALGLRSFVFTDDDARVTSELYARTRQVGLSFGDRACLALGRRLGVPVLTADRAWLQVDLGQPVNAVR